MWLCGVRCFGKQDGLGANDAADASIGEAVILEDSLVPGRGTGHTVMVNAHTQQPATSNEETLGVGCCTLQTACHGA